MAKKNGRSKPLSINTISQTTPKINNEIKLKKEDLLNVDPLTKNQNLFFSFYDENIPFLSLLGFAGCGKTFIALYKALNQVLQRGQSIKKVVLVRSSVQSRDVGYLPGDIKEKMAVFEQPYKQICKDLFGRGDAWNLLKADNKIEFESTSFLRGTTYNNSVVIVDECQSLNWHEINTVCTRMGNNSRLIFCGDNRQNDLIKSKNDQSGFKTFTEVAKHIPSYFSINFEIDDIVRSGICKEWILAEYNYFNYFNHFNK